MPSKAIIKVTKKKIRTKIPKSKVKERTVTRCSNCGKFVKS